MSKSSRSAGACLLAAILCATTVSIAAAQTIIKNFSGVSLDDADALGTGSTPPDTMGAVGPNHFAEFVNGAFAVYGKDGTRQKLISDPAFWQNAGISAGTISSGLTDPRIAYDVLSGRWFASEITLELTGNQILLARSETSDPGGTWKAVYFAADASSGFDYDTLGVDSNAVYVAANSFDSLGSLLGVSLYSIPKADLIAATPTLANMTRFDNLDDTIYGFTLQGVSNPGANSGHGVVIAIDNAAFNYVDRSTVNNPGEAGATLSARVRIPISYDTIPNSAHQPGGKRVDTLDDRFTGAIRQAGGNIFMANTILQGSRDAVHWIVIRESDNVVLGEGRIYDSTYDYFQPSIAANSQGRVMLAFNRSGTTAPAGNISIYGAVGSIGGSTVSMGSPFLIKQGTVSNFGPSFDSSPYRWGDYSATMVDPTDEELFWTIQEIPVTSGVWGTQITLISLATNAPNLEITSVGTNVLVSWPLSADPAYALQSTTNLAASATWSAVGTAATISSNRNIVSLAAQKNAQFFRLKK